MSGHSHWAGIKQRKGVNDAKRAGVFTKYGRLIAIAAREGGGDPEMNFKLKMAIDRARYENMPKDTIERAVKKGTGELKDGAEIEEIIYEGYGPGNVAMLIKTATDNRNRTGSEIRSILTKAGGKPASEGGVKFMFKLVGSVAVAVGEKGEDELEMLAIEAGAEDMASEEEIFVVYTKIEDLKTVKENLEKVGLKIEGAELVYVPTQKMELDENSKVEYEKLLEKLDEHEDVQEIYDNL
ncbi:MAG: YebC/PmpR family DNA-binding transcriptional regulator [Candidatus Moranbacteria bacterium]|nr:YebC/PmpR family DNA-binding transcriptional regulator [Candidatus Moranbacteria bacterium]